MSEERFWAKVVRRGPDECWSWTGSHEVTGYGVFYLAGRKFRAHRYALTLRLGRPIAPGLLACHSCNNARCVNPAHLYEGTHGDNASDKVRADRHHRGNRHHATRLDEQDVRQIVARYRAGGVTQTQLAREFSVSQSEISRMVAGKSWRHLWREVAAA